MKIKGLILAVVTIAVCFCTNAFAVDYFDPLFRVAKVTGKVWVLRPGETKPILAQDDFRYPYGSKIIVDGVDPTLPKDVEQKNEVMVVFADDYQIRLGMDTVITTEKNLDDAGNAKVYVGVEKGFVSTFLTIPSSKTGDEVEDAKIAAMLNAFVIKTTLAEVTGLVDRNEIRVATDANGQVKSRYKIESGLVTLEGQQFKILKTRRKSVFEIFGDPEFTRITVSSGEVTARVNRGDDTPYQSTFRHGSTIKIWRSYTQIQKKLVVVVLMTMPNGTVEHYQYIENPSDVLRSLLGTGEAVTGGSEESFDEGIEDEEMDSEFLGDEEFTDESYDDMGEEDYSSDDLSDDFSDDDFFSDDFIF